MAISISQVELIREDRCRYWDPQSEPYPPAEVLMQYLNSGWKIHNPVYREFHYLAKCHKIDLYHLTLMGQGELIEMIVLPNPIVLKILAVYSLTVQTI